MADYSKVPANATLKPEPFKVNIDDAAVNELKALLLSAKFPKDTYENQTEDFSFGVSKGWVEDTVDYWGNHFDWRKQEERINSVPHFKAAINDDDGTLYNIHFVALFSQKADALPIVFNHGWPGSFLEFIGVLDLLKNKYTPETLPYHVIVPSLPGFTFSELPVLERTFTLMDIARIFHKLVAGLGFDRYITQGGDIGVAVALFMAGFNPQCKGVHINASMASQPEGFDLSKLTDKEKAGLERGKEFQATGSAYALMHGTRPATIGAVLSSSPVALLAWIGEKFITWSDDTPSLDLILESISLYWFTNTFPSSIYAYQAYVKMIKEGPPKFPPLQKPLGFSYFPKELSPKPKDWVAATGNLVYFADHDQGGHFAALELPEVLLQDVEEFVTKI